MAQPMTRARVSPEEYLELERAAEERHEFLDGEIVAMSGGTAEHSLIAQNIIGELRSALRPKPCKVFTSDMRIRIEAANRYTYADAVVVCGPPRLADEARDTLLNPTAIFEVLSDSTESYDRGEKFAGYRTVPSVEEYVLVSQKQEQVEHFHRQADGSWLLHVYGSGETVSLPALGCELKVDKVYFKVRVPGDFESCGVHSGHGCSRVFGDVGH
jgi:Uma2 family endonuclease